MTSGDIFGGHSDGLEKAQKDILSAAEAFKNEYENIYTIIEALIGSEWSSPGATMIAEKIVERKPNLEDLYKVIVRYSEYCGRTAGRVIENEDNIIEGVSGNNG